MNFIKKIYPQLALVLVAWALIYIAFGELFTQPNKFLFVAHGDGLKNYYTVAHYIKYGEGLRSTGMLYPYAELALYTDSHFGIAVILRWVHVNLFPISDYSVGIINFLALFSLAFCPLFLFLIMRKLQVSIWYAFIASLIIGFLSPQIQRFGAHYSLSYAIFIPLIWYFLIRFEESVRKWPWVILIIFSILFFGSIHPYFAPLGSFFFLSYGFIYLIANFRSWKQNRRKILSLFAIGFGALLIFTLVTSIIDPVSDRHPAPFGIFFYQATFESIFLPSFGPFLDLWSDFTLVRLANPEGRAYVGLIGLITLIIIALRALIKVAEGNFKRSLKLTNNKCLNYHLWAAGLMVLLATAFPFLHFEFLLDVFPPLRQFRSLGRFAWIFYYVFTVYVAYYFYLIYRSLSIRNAKKIGVSMVVFIFFFWGLESFVNTTTVVDNITKSKSINSILKDSNQDYSTILKSVGYSPDDFQAMLAFPYFNNGSEKFYIVRSFNAMYEALKSNYDTGVPIASGFSARTSLQHSYNLVQLLSSDLVKKEILPDLNEKPFLILAVKEKLLLDEQALLKKSEEIFENKWISLHKLPMAAFKDRKSEIYAQYHSEKDSLNTIKGLKTNALEGAVVLLDFDSKPTDLSFAGAGALYSGNEHQMTIFKDSLSVQTAMRLNISTWIYSDRKSSSFPTLYVEVYNQEGKKISVKNYNPKFYTEYEYGWVKATLLVDYAPGNEIFAYLMHENLRSKNYVIDNFLIRPENSEVFHSIESDGSFFYNNYKIPAQE